MALISSPFCIIWAMNRTPSKLAVAREHERWYAILASEDYEAAYRLMDGHYRAVYSPKDFEG